jgi:acetate---CoA ligase (ADP-forming)
VVAVESSLAHDREELVAKMVAAVPTSPIVLTSLSEDDQIPAELTRVLAEAGIAYVPTVERAVAALAACAPTSALPAVPSADAATGVVEEVRGLEWIAERLPATTPWSRWHVMPDDVEAAAAELGLPLVVKAAGRTIEHRTELGAVRFVRLQDELAPAIESVGRVCREHDDAVMLQEAAAPGFELLVSVVRDPEFGPVAFVRPGGTLAELMAGQAVVWSGWSPDRRADVLRASRIGELLSSYRGGKSYDIDALMQVLGSCLDAVTYDMTFLEMNPVIVHQDGVTLIDAVARA